MRALRLMLLLVLALALPASPSRSQDHSVAVLDAATIDAEIARAMGRVEQATTSKARAGAELAGLADRRTAAEERLRLRARALYRLRHAGMLPVAGGLDAMLAHVSRTERLERMVAADLASARALRLRGGDLRAEIQRATEDEAQSRARLHALQTRKTQLAEEQRAEENFAQAFEAPAVAVAPPPSAMPVGTFRVRDDAEDSASAFAQLRGTLPMPVAGSVDVRDVQAEDGPALELRGRPGASVRAVADGRVAFAGDRGARGRLVIVDHGDRWFSVVAGLAELDVRVGDDVSRGARLGGAGEDGVVFEVRRGTQAQNPRSWLGL